MKPFRLFCYMFLLAFLTLMVHNVQQHSYLFELTDHRINLFSHKFVNKKQRIVHGQGAFNITYSTVVFNFDDYRFS